jgi:DNA polymerase-3 subunit gamma/tau
MSAPIPISSVSPQPIPETRGATALELAPAPSPDPSVSDPQLAVVQALTAAAQTSAAEALDDALWTIANGEALIQTTLSKTMLPAVLNSEAEKLLRSVLRDAGIHKLTLLPAAAAPPAKKPRPARTGSVQARALEHPMVQQAQKLFSADLQSVIDLREPD